MNNNMLVRLFVCAEFDNAAARRCQVGSQRHGGVAVGHWCYYRREDQGNCFKPSAKKYPRVE